MTTREYRTSHHVEFDYRPEIDGLRALAVISVILFHGGFTTFQGGYLGVDIFFVISGYLITGIILKDIAAKRFSLWAFYERRARRILPALFTVLLACLPFAWSYMTPAQRQDFAGSLFGVTFFVSNLYFWRTSGYFDAASEEKPLLHTWSLGIEEQFYVLFPIVLLFLWSLRRRPMLGAIALLAVTSFILAEWLVHRHPTAAFFLPLTRAWELLAGALVSILSARGCSTYLPRLAREFSAATGFAVILAAILLQGKTTPNPSAYTLIPVLGTALVLLFAQKGTATAKLLSFGVFVQVGLVSYSAYLWHQPLFAFARIQSVNPISTPTILTLTGICFILAYLTWRYIENPFRNQSAVPLRTLISTNGAVFIILLAVGASTYATKGFNIYFYNSLQPAQLALQLKLQAAIATGGYNSMIDNGACKFWSPKIDAAFLKRYESCAQNLKAIFVLGDSHAMDTYNAIALSSQHAFIVSVSKGGCRIASPAEDCSYSAFDAFLQKHHESIRMLIYTQSGWDIISKDNPPFDVGLARRIQERVSAIATRVPTLWLGPHPELRTDLKRYNPLIHTKLDPILVSEIPLIDAEFAKLSRGTPYQYVSQLELLNFTLDDLFIDGDFTYSDRDHWSTHGERLFGRRLVAGLKTYIPD